MLEDRDETVTGHEGDAAPAGAGKTSRPTPRDLRLIREWSPDGEVRVDPDKLAAALAFLPEEGREEAARTVRGVLGFYLHRRNLERRPDPKVRAAQWRTTRARTRALRRALLADPEPGGAKVPEVMLQDAGMTRRAAMSGPELEELARMLLRLEAAAADFAQRAEEDAAGVEMARRGVREGPAPDVPMRELLEELRPLWEPLKGGARRAFVVAALAAVGEEWGEDAIRKRQERMDVA